MEPSQLALFLEVRYLNLPFKASYTLAPSWSPSQIPLALGTSPVSPHEPVHVPLARMVFFSCTNPKASPGNLSSLLLKAAAADLCTVSSAEDLGLL